MEDRKYEILSTDYGFAVRNKETNEVVHEYDIDEAWDYLTANSDVKSALQRVISKVI